MRHQRQAVYDCAQNKREKMHIFVSANKPEDQRGEKGVIQGENKEIKEESASDEHSSRNKPALPKLTGEELTKQLKNQLEYYFSR